MWRHETGECLHVLSHPGEIYSVAAHPKRAEIVTACQDQIVYFWNARTGQPLRTSKTFPDVLRSLVYSPDGKEIHVATYHGLVYVLNAETGEDLGAFSEEGGTVLSAAPDGLTIAATTRQGHFRILDRETRLRLFHYDGPDPLRGLAHAPDGSAIAVVSEGGILRIWSSKRSPF